ncbi:MAG: hypothetical protein QOC94_3240 [Actinoplanes sp.]|jgi:NADP-dependent 3-hydroxy acid dehydrogenase YdfG|nr:hypothetical protein [Actinoplanes sp.]
MTIIAIIGAGPCLGAAVARRFGAEGFGIALVSRSQDKLDRLAAGLRAEGYTARGYAADVRDRKASTLPTPQRARPPGTTAWISPVGPRPSDRH